MLTPRAGIIWDLDHTLYEADQGIADGWNLALAQTAVRCGYYLTVEEATAAMEKSHTQYGLSLAILKDRSDFNERDFLAQSFPDGHISYLLLINACQKTLAAINAHQHLPQAILTSGMRIWAERVLQRLELHGHFPPHRIVSLEDVEYHPKASSRLPFDRAADVLQLPLETLMMVEDNANNLKMAKDLGLVTVLVTHGDEPAAGLSHVDFVVHKAYDVFDLINSGQIPWQK